MPKVTGFMNLVGSGADTLSPSSFYQLSWLLDPDDGLDYLELLNETSVIPFLGCDEVASWIAHCCHFP